LAAEGNSTVTCVAAVFDVDLNPVVIGANNGCANTDCNIDHNDSFPPLGNVKFFAGTPATPGEQIGQCSSPGGSLDYLNTANRPGGGALPGTLPAVPEYAAWCTAQVTLPVGTTSMFAAYSGDSLQGAAAHTGVPSQPVAVTLT
jgi:hypothetical protein